jgi:hypothetical protein
MVELLNYEADNTSSGKRPEGKVENGVDLAVRGLP